MDLVRDKVGPIYFRYLGAALASAMICNIYCIVDLAMVGHYHGPEGTAALAVVGPLWNTLYSLGLFTGLGGGVLFSVARGGGSAKREGDEYFSAAFICTVILSLICWILIAIFDRELLTFFGAGGNVLHIARRYLLPIKFAIPVFLFNQTLAAFLRNDGNPVLAAAAVLCGGCFNMVGDYICVFTFDLGSFGAGIATALGATLSCSIMASHFFLKRNTLSFVLPKDLFAKAKKILTTGFSTFFIDIAPGILAVLFNRQIMRYSGTNALAIYGVIINIVMTVQCCGYSAGQAAQPLLSANYGAGRWGRMRSALRYALWSVAFFGVVCVALVLLFPEFFIRAFMKPTAEVLAIGPYIIRSYGIAFLLLPVNIFSTYYFQSLMRPKISFAISFTRGIALSGILIILLPLLAGERALWFAVPITEIVVFAAVVYYIIKCTRELYERGKRSVKSA